MKILNKYNKCVEFIAEDGESIAVSYDNRGEPFREGIYLCARDRNRNVSVDAFLGTDEALQIRDLLNTLYPTEEYISR